VTVARRGDTTVVIDTGGTRTKGAGTDSISVIAPDSTAPFRTPAAGPLGVPVPPGAGLSTPGTPGSSFPPVAPADVAALRAKSPAVPVAGVAKEKLVDSFDDARGASRRHNAIDIVAPRNTPVVATTDGRVLKLHNSTAGGLTIYATDASSRYIFLYGHLDSYRPGLMEGAAVKRGEIIGFVGTTGNANPTGPHLHFAITRSDNVREWWKGTPLNPFLVYRGE